MFIRKKKYPDGRAAFQVVENRKIAGKVRQRVVATLGQDATLRRAVQTAGLGWTCLKTQGANPAQIEKALDKYCRLLHLQATTGLP